MDFRWGFAIDIHQPSTINHQPIPRKMLSLKQISSDETPFGSALAARGIYKLLPDPGAAGTG
jgi:hypothetical protein